MVVEIAELPGFKRAELERVKNIISTQKDTIRLAYKKYSRDYYRRCVFVGTTNDNAPLPNDLTGLRRFVLIGLKKKLDSKQFVQILIRDREQLWGEAVELFKNKVTPNIPKELWSRAARVAEQNRDHDQIFEQATLEYIEGKEKIELKLLLNRLKDQGWIQDFRHSYQKQAAGILKKEGFRDCRIQEKGKRVRYWIREQKLLFPDKPVPGVPG